MGDGPIQQDSISIAFSVLAASLLIFLSTFGPDLMLRSLFAFSLLIGGLFLSRIIKSYKEDVDIDTGEGRSMIQYAVIALGVIALVSYTAPKIMLSIDTSTLSVTDAFMVPRMFGVLIAVSEEAFFRGFATNFFVSRIGSAFGVVASGAFFAIYHASVYGSDVSLLLYVFGAGMMLSYVALRTQRVSTTMISHVVINGMVGA